MWFVQEISPAPVGLGDTAEHGLKAGQHQAAPGKETLQVPEGMPCRRTLSFLFKKGGYMVHSPNNHSRCQLSAATALDWWSVSSKSLKQISWSHFSPPRREAASLGLYILQGCFCDLPTIVPVAQSWAASSAAPLETDIERQLLQGQQGGWEIVFSSLTDLTENRWNSWSYSLIAELESHFQVCLGDGLA